MAGEESDDALGTAPVLPSIDLDLAQARAEAALFGDAAPVTVGRYTLIERAGAGGMGVVWSAYDPELGRAVAIKLASSGDAAARARARDEGRALARLSHPNVVPIYDVVELGDRVFLVMELVKGETLRAASRAQTVAQLVRAYGQAADGLAAAHAAGLVHRDFKPDNAILGADGRVRVLDFGLAHEAGADAVVAGTPRYMAPEQRAGAAVTAAVDQYALAVALRESVGARGPLPRWLAPIVARGAAEAPDARFPSMAAMAAVLARGVNRWRRRAAIGVGVAVAGGLVAAFALGRSQEQEHGVAACGGGPEIMAAAWGPDARAALAGRVAAMAAGDGPDARYAADGGPRLIEALDGYREAWIERHRGACLAHRRGEISAALLDRRAACLGGRRAALATIATLAATPTAALPDLVHAAGALPSVAACADDHALLARVAPPPAELAAKVAAVDERLAEIAVERDAARVIDAQSSAEHTLVAAKGIGYRPLLARAYLARGRVALTADRGDLGLRDFVHARDLATAAGDDALAVEAFARQIFAAMWLETLRDDPDSVPVMTALGERAGAPGRFARALLANNLGALARSRGELAVARDRYQAAMAEAGPLDGDGAVELTVIAINLVQLLDDAAARARLGDALVAARVRQLGALHPLTFRARGAVALALDDPDAMRAALAPVIAALAATHPGLAAETATYRAASLLPAMVAGDTAAVIALADGIVADAGRDVAPHLVALARAYRLLAAGDRTASAAFAALARDAPAADAPWWAQRRTSEVLLGAALAALAAGDRAAARRALDAAAAIDARVAATTPPPYRAQHAAVIATLRAR